MTVTESETETEVERGFDEILALRAPRPQPAEQALRVAARPRLLLAQAMNQRQDR